MDRGTKIVLIKLSNIETFDINLLKKICKKVNYLKKKIRRCTK